MSSVSGGSVIAALWAYSDDDFPNFDARVTRVLKKGLTKGIICNTLFSPETPKILATLATSGLLALVASLLALFGGLLARVGWVANPLSWLSRWISERFRRYAKLANLKETSQCLALIERADLRPGSLVVLLSCDALARLIECQPDQINTDELTIEAPFRMRRRGVELKLHLGDAPPKVDRTLIRNIVKARRWLKMIIEGKTFAGIAEAESTSKRRVQDVVDLALFAPEILDAIASGEQPNGLTTDYLIKTGFSEVWSKQKKQFAEI